MIQPLLFKYDPNNKKGESANNHFLLFYKIKSHLTGIEDTLLYYAQAINAAFNKTLLVFKNQQGWWKLLVFTYDFRIYYHLYSHVLLSIKPFLTNYMVEALISGELFTRFFTKIKMNKLVRGCQSTLIFRCNFASDKKGNGFPD